MLGEVLSFIYPPELVINNTNISARKVNYLDLQISIYRGKFRVILYDKRNDYDFKVISYPFLDGNIPKNLSYGVFSSQLARFCRINTTLKGFLDNVNDLYRKLSCQGFERAALRKKFNKFYQSKIDTWGKFGIDILPHINSIFN